MQVVEVLLHFNKHKDWTAAFLAAVPNRKRNGEEDGSGVSRSIKSTALDNRLSTQP